MCQSPEVLSRYLAPGSEMDKSVRNASSRTPSPGCDGPKDINSSLQPHTVVFGDLWFWFSE
jgi:hypothetical protein